LRRQLFWSILGVAGLVLFIVAMATAVVTRRTAREQSQRQLTNQTAIVAERIETDLGDRTGQQIVRVLNSRDGALADFVDGAATALNGAVVRIGIVENDATFPTAPSLDALSLDVSRLRSERILSFKQVLEGETVVGVARIVELDGISLVVVAGRVDAPLVLRDILRSIALPLFIAAVLAAVAAELLARRIAGRLQQLEQAAAALASGETTARVDVPKLDAIGELGMAFNSMADQIESSAKRERSFLMNVSHDLRTPLTTISGYAEVLEDSDESESRRIGSVLTGETQRLRRLVEDIMLLARLEAREFNLVIEEVDMGAHLNEVVVGFAHRARELGVELKTDILPTGIIHTDPDRVAQIAGNLIENALRFAPDMGLVEFSVEDSNNGVTLTVSDSGPGVEEADAPFVFDRFFTGRRHHRPEGSGLGLSIVAQLVELLEGEVTTSESTSGGLAVAVWVPDAPR